jgi:putative restriction endonuclease
MRGHPTSLSAMRAYVGITDKDWFDQLRSTPELAEANFWQPGGNRLFGAIRPGELFLFKLHSPNNYIVGGGIFAHSSVAPVSLAWKSFGIANGARSIEEMRHRVERYRRQPADKTDDYSIGCIILTETFFLPEPSWIPVPENWHPNIVQGKTYDLDNGLGASLFARIEAALRAPLTTGIKDAPPLPEDRYGKPILIRPRLGQRSFRFLVTDAYQRRCAMTGERVVPVLEAAHVRPYSREGEHKLENGLLLRSDLHALFDGGYLTVTPGYKIEVSRRIREEFENGKDYYALHGRTVREPAKGFALPSEANLRWHNETLFKG